MRMNEAAPAMNPMKIDIDTEDSALGRGWFGPGDGEAVEDVGEGVVVGGAPVMDKVVVGRAEEFVLPSGADAPVKTVVETRVTVAPTTAETSAA
jgi:hypothetical protein